MLIIYLEGREQQGLPTLVHVVDLPSLKFSKLIVVKYWKISDFPPEEPTSDNPLQYHCVMVGSEWYRGGYDQLGYNGISFRGSKYPITEYGMNHGYVDADFIN